jgi:SAM-dependent methyltransferase
MEFHQTFGLSLPEKNWVPAPRYLLRRHRILKLLENKEPGHWLEIGCGAAALLYEFARRGFQCSTLETSASARRVAHYVADQANFELNIYDQALPNWNSTFDYIGAFEVLEHIEDDKNALSQWSGWLKPGGLLFLSVPAHMSKWTATDEWAGHYRRYERKELLKIFEDENFEIEHFESYGFPLANIIDPLRASIHQKQLAKRRSHSHHAEKEQNTAQSGIERSTESKIFPLLKSVLGVAIMRVAFYIQDFFLNRDLGNGYLVIARKKSLLD